jgi:hypothetical protein
MLCESSYTFEPFVDLSAEDSASPPNAPPLKRNKAIVPTFPPKTLGTAERSSVYDVADSCTLDRELNFLCL